MSGLFLALLLASMIISNSGGVTGLLRMPTRNPVEVGYVEGLLGPVVHAPAAGHDGREYFKLANDPWLLSPEEHARFLDRPTYFAQRMLYPLLASGLGFLGPKEVVWGLVVVNVVALAVGTWATSMIGASLGGTPWLGLFFVLNPGLIYELAIDGGSIVGFSLAAWALVEVDRGRWNRAAALLALGVLARESLALIAVGVFLFLWFVRGQRVWRIVLVPAAAGLCWAAWVRIRLSGLPDGSNPASFDLPMRGISEAGSYWLSTGGIVLGLGALVLFCGVITIAEAVRRPSILAWGALPYAPFLLVLDAALLRQHHDVTRAVAPLITAGLVLTATLLTPRNQSPDP